MLKSLGVIGLLVALQGQSCIEQAAGPPEKLARTVEAEFRPYFPNAKAWALPDQKHIQVLTCTQGLGSEVTKELDIKLAAKLRANKTLQELRQPKVVIAELLGQRVPYDYFVVGFEDHLLYWYRSDGQVRRKDVWGGGLDFEWSKKYVQDYDRDCGFSLEKEREEMMVSVQKQVEKMITRGAFRYDDYECNALQYAFFTNKGTAASETLRKLWKDGGCEREVQR